MVLSSQPCAKVRVLGLVALAISAVACGSGLPIGGDSMLAFSAELRAMLSGNFGGVLFVDAGNVWADPWAFERGELRYAIGPGFRYQTPVGARRIDVGYQLNPIPGLLVNGNAQTRRIRFHFSIGQAF